jgi:hypothetical protein
MVLQQGCCPTPKWQSPAIFWQHAFSAAVICEFGRHASAGIARHRASKLKTTTERQRTITRCYPERVCRCKLAHEVSRVGLKVYRPKPNGLIQGFCLTVEIFPIALIALRDRGFERYGLLRHL